MIVSKKGIMGNMAKPIILLKYNFQPILAYNDRLIAAEGSLKAYR